MGWGRGIGGRVSRVVVVSKNGWGRELDCFAGGAGVVFIFKILLRHHAMGTDDFEIHRISVY